MRTLVFAALTGAGLALSLVAHADDAQPVRRAAIDTVAFGDPQRVVCLHLYHEGTLIRRPVCKTAQTWASEYQETRTEIREDQIRGLLRHW